MAHRPIELARGDGLPQSFLLVLVDDVVVAVADFYRRAVSANSSRDIIPSDPGVAEAALGVDLRGSSVTAAARRHDVDSVRAAQRRRRQRDVLSRRRLISTRRRHGLDLQVGGLDLPVRRLRVNLHQF